MPESTPDFSFSAVAAWVAPMIDEEKVGWTSYTDMCPLSVLGDRQGFTDVHVTGLYVSWSRGKRMRTSDLFVKAFVTECDKIGPCKEVTAGQVRAILAELAPEFGS